MKGGLLTIGLASAVVVGPASIDTAAALTIVEIPNTGFATDGRAITDGLDSVCDPALTNAV